MEPLSREFLLSRGYCCNMGCSQCPWRESLTNGVEKRKDIEPLKKASEKSGAESGRRNKVV